MGNLELAKALYNEDTAYWYNKYYCFRIACLNGHYNIVTWLLQTLPEIPDLLGYYEIECLMINTRDKKHTIISELLSKILIKIDLFTS